MCFRLARARRRRVKRGVRQVRAQPRGEVGPMGLDCSLHQPRDGRRGNACRRERLAPRRAEAGRAGHPVDAHRRAEPRRVDLRREGFGAQHRAQQRAWLGLGLGLGLGFGLGFGLGLGVGVGLGRELGLGLGLE